MEEDIQNYSLTVMFRGTPSILVFFVGSLQKQLAHLLVHKNHKKNYQN